MLSLLECSIGTFTEQSKNHFSAIFYLFEIAKIENASSLFFEFLDQLIRWSQMIWDDPNLRRFKGYKKGIQRKNLIQFYCIELQIRNGSLIVVNGRFYMKDFEIWLVVKWLSLDNLLMIILMRTCTGCSGVERQVT